MNTYTEDQAKALNQARATTPKTVACATCGETIPRDGNHCVAFGIYQCGDCWKKKPCFEP